MATIWLVSDCGPHFRSYENCAHFLFTMVKMLVMKVHILYLGEQHGKGACDRLFGWCNAWLQSYIQTKPIHGLKDLVDAFTKGGQAMMQDPSGPAFVVQVGLTPGCIVRPSACSSTAPPSKSRARTAFSIPSKRGPLKDKKKQANKTKQNHSNHTKTPPKTQRSVLFCFNCFP